MTSAAATMMPLIAARDFAENSPVSSLEVEMDFFCLRLDMFIWPQFLVSGDHGSVNVDTLHFGEANG